MSEVRDPWEFPTIPVDEALSRIQAGGARIIDVRDPEEYGESHVLGAANVPLKDVRWFSTGLRRGRQATLFVCCEGGRSEDACVLAGEAGHFNRFSVEGGTQAWMAAGLPTVGF